MIQVSEGIGNEITFLGVSVFLGVILFLCYDVLRIFRRVVPHGTVWIAVEDFFYWLLVTAAVFVVLYQENDGMVRGFALGGILVGMLLYYTLFSRYVVRFFAWGINGIKRIAGRGIKKIFGPIFKILKKALRFLKKQLKKFWKTVRMGLCKL